MVTTADFDRTLHSILGLTLFSPHARQANRDSFALTYARAIAVVGLGVSCGLQASISLWTMPSIYSVDTLAPRDRLHLWSQLFDRGGKTMVPLQLIVSTVLGVCAYVATAPATYLPTTFIGRHRKATLAVASVLTLANLPYTFFALIPGVTTLKKAEADIIKDPAANNARVETDTQVEEWTARHLVRVGLGFSAFALAVAELASA